MPPRVYDTCTYSDCSRKHLAKGLCALHYERKRKGADMDYPPKDIRRLNRKPWLHKEYLWITAPDGRVMMQHRYVMEQHLGRRLESSELVHHKNEVKTDNHIDNLELKDFSSHTAHHRAHRMPCVVCGLDSLHGGHGLCAIHYQHSRTFLEMFGVALPDDKTALTIILVGTAMAIDSSEVEDRLVSLKRK